MILSFELSMPNRGSWNGQWSGQENRYLIHRSVSKKTVEKLKPLEGNSARNFYYNFGDGWGANVAVRRVDAATKRKEVKASRGFFGYDWMVDSILSYGRIVNSAQQKELDSKTA